MPLNLATLRTRTLTAAVFVVVMLTGLLWNHWSFFVLFTIIHFGCWKEYQQLIAKIDGDYAAISTFHKYGIMIAGWCIMLYCTNSAFNVFAVHPRAIGWWLGLVLVALLLIELLFKGNTKLKIIGYSGGGLVYISLPLGLMISLRCQGLGDFFGHWIDKGWILPLVLIGSIWVNDTMAYIVGSLAGKTPFSKISPKKTWEGTLGGAVLAVIVMALIMKWSIPETALIHWIMIPAIAAITGTAGDLFESKLKRMANVKDSGHIMPGHGGFLDRFDSLLFATPFVWLYVLLIMY